MFNYFSNSKAFLENFKSFLFSLLGAILIYAIIFACTPKTKSFATINITKLTKDYIDNERQKKLDAKQLNSEASAYATNLEVSIKKLAEKYDLVLLPSEAVIAGLPDYTQELNAMMASQK